MPRPGHCPSCDVSFDATDRTPMVSVVCGHSLCKPCATLPTPPAHSSDTDDSSGSEDADRDAPRCPVCAVPLAGFVKNFEALAALEPTPSSHPNHPSAPDLTSVVHGDLVIDRSAIQFVRTPSHELGKGASAVVYKGVHNGGSVAIKCIRTMSDSFATEDRLRRELRNASRLKNPHIVEFRGAAWDYEDGPSSPRNVLLVTELMAGGNLRESLNCLSDETGLAVESFVTIALQIARGIEYLHAEGLAHRDIKSANILLTERLTKCSNHFSSNVRAKIADFGLSKYIDKATGGGTVMQSIMEPGRLEATYAYLAPEAFGGDKTNVIRRDDSDDESNGRFDEMAKKRDIYALGVLFWEMLTGRIPWSGVSLPDVYVRVCVRSDRPGPALDDTAVDRTFHRLIDRCWAQNPQRRPSARSIVAKLEKLATRYRVVDSNNAAAVEAVSVVSGLAPRGSNNNDMPDVQSEGHRDTDNANLGHETLRAYHKMPSASTVHTTQNDETKTHSNGPDPSEGAVDNGVDEVANQYDDTWVDELNKSVQRQIQDQAGHSPVPGSGRSNAPGDALEGASQNRRSVRARPVGTDSVAGGVIPTTTDGGLARATSHGLPTNVAQGVPTSANTVQHGTKSSATAVAATAAAIAAAKDRERKRDDVRHARTGPATAAVRVARGAAANTGAAATGGALGETSFQSLVGATEPYSRNGVKDKSERVMFYENSDEEAEAFDPDRAAADEALAESNGQFSTSHQPARAATPVNRVTGLQQTQRSTSLGRVTGRPKSPVVRRPMSPALGRQIANAVTPTAARTTVVTPEEDLRTTNSLSRASEIANTPPVPKRSTSANRGRLGRTLSASTPANNAVRPAAPTTNPNGNEAVSTTGYNGTALSTDLLSSVAAVTDGSGSLAKAAGGTASGLVTSASTTDTNGRRAFIRRMRSNETTRRMARSSSSTGVEDKRAKGGGAMSAITAKSSPAHVSNTPGSEGDVEDYNSVLPSFSNVSGKENFMSVVDSVDKDELVRMLGQRMQPLRLAGLAHAALLSSKHRNDEEILRSCCAYLHRLTVPISSAGGKGNPNQPVGNGEITVKEQLSIRKYLKARQGVEALLQALHPPEVRHPTTLCYGLLALGNLTAWDLETQEQFRRSLGVVQVTQVMKYHSQNSGVQEKGCYALACVGAAYPAKSKNIFEQSGALDLVIRALSDVQKRDPNDAVMKQACAALGAMCSSCPANALYAGRHDALGYLMASFERFRKVSKGDGGGRRSEMRLVCKAFIDLLCHAENRKMVGSKGGCTMILRSMRIFRLESDFIQRGLLTLSQLCTLQPCASQILQADGVEDVVATMERFRMQSGMQRDGCRMLTVIMRTTGDLARRRLVTSGGGETIVFALERFGAIPDNHDDVVLEAYRTLEALFRMENPTEGEILCRRMRKVRCEKAVKISMASHRQYNDIQDVGKNVLRLLSSLRGNGLWNWMRNGSRRWG